MLGSSWKMFEFHFLRFVLNRMLQENFAYILIRGNREHLINFLGAISTIHTLPFVYNGGFWCFQYTATQPVCSCIMQHNVKNL